MSPSASDSKAAGAATAFEDSEPGRKSLVELASSFRTAFRTLRRLRGRETHLLGGEISHAQFELMIELRRRGPLAVGELAEVAEMSAASVSQMLDRLVEQGHVERVRSEEDRRVVKVQLTGQGLDSIEPIIALKWQRWQETFEDVSDEELETASKVLDRVASVFGDRAEDD